MVLIQLRQRAAACREVPVFVGGHSNGTNEANPGNIPSPWVWGLWR